MKNLLQFPTFASPGLRLAGAALALFAAIPLARAALSAAAQVTPVTTIHVGVPLNTNRDGEVTIEIEYEYVGAAGKEKDTKKVVVPIPKGTTQPDKVKAVEKALNDAAPKVPADTGTPTFEAKAGLGSTVQVAPTTPADGSFKDAKVRIKSMKDKHTNERDQVQQPPGGAYAVTSLSLEGPIATHDGFGNVSILSVESNYFGVIDFSLKANSNKLELLAEIEQVLGAMGAQTLLLENGPELLALLPEGMRVGIGTDDDTMATVLAFPTFE